MNLNNVVMVCVSVVLDRRYDKNCDIGGFELAYKQPMVTVPPYIGINLAVEGQLIRKPGTQPRRPDPALNGPATLSMTRKHNGAMETTESRTHLNIGGDRSKGLQHGSKERPRAGLVKGSTGLTTVSAVGGGPTSSGKSHYVTGSNAHTSNSNSAPFTVDAGSPSAKDSIVPVSQPPPTCTTSPTHPTHPTPTKSSSLPHTRTAATPLTFGLNSMTSGLQASLQKLEADALPAVSATLRRPSEPRKLLGAHLLNPVSEHNKRDSIRVQAKCLSSTQVRDVIANQNGLAHTNISMEMYKWDSEPVCNIKRDNLLPLRKMNKPPVRKPKKRRPGFHANRLAQTEKAARFRVTPPHHNAVLHMPKVPYVNVSYRLQPVQTPKLKYMQSHTTLDHIQQVSADLEKIHRLSATTEIK